MAYLTLLAPCVLLSICFLRLLYKRCVYGYRRDARGCAEPQHYMHSDPLLGLDLFLREKKAHEMSEGLKFQRRFFGQWGKTVGTHYCGTRIIRTMDKQNIQSVLASSFQDFGLQPLREGIAEPFFGKGINTTDGRHWEYSRSLVKPTFSRAEISSFDYLERHLHRFFELLPNDNTDTVDLQPLFGRFFLDTSTEFLFGKSADTLLPNPSAEDKNFIDSYQYVMQGLGIRVRLAWMKFLHRDAKWFEAVELVHRWVDKYIDAAMEQHNTSEADGKPDLKSMPKTGRQYFLLQEMVKHSKDKAHIRSEVLAVFMPSQDTQSFLLSNTFHLLARNKQAWTRLRTEILAHGDRPLTFESLKSLRYLQWTINESLRVHPISESAPRVCLNDTVLPTGGGPDGDKPIFVQKGDMVNVYMNCLHHDTDVWGVDDVDEFRPERWEHVRPLWGYIPFGGGPRTCPAQQLVYTEAAYVIVRMVQRFAEIESRDPNPWTESWRLGPVNKYGCQVALTPA